MAPASTTSSDREETPGGRSECQALYDAATPEIFLNNAFRITGLPIDATARDIAKHLAQRKLRAELGEPESARSSPFTREAPPSIEQVRDAEQKLRNPEERVVDEIFWFWPVDKQGCKSDVALHALAAGDTSTAEQLWKSLESSPESGSAAIHNVAIRWHLTALSLERQWNSRKGDDKAREALTKCWNYALKRWDHLLSDSDFWGFVSARVKALDDPRLSTAFVDRLRDAMPGALANINVSLTLKHVENDEADLVVMHVRLMRASRLGPAGSNEFGTKVLSESKKRIRQHIQSAQQHLATSPATALDAARDLVAILTKYANLFSIAGLSQDNAANDILDEGAAVCMNCAVRANKQTSDDSAFVDVLVRVLEVSRSSATRERAQKNLEAGRSALLSVQLDPVYRSLAEVRDSTDSPRARLQSFEATVEPLLSRALADLPASEEARSTVADAAAHVLRDISIDAWNKDKDGVTAAAAMKLAMKYACGKEVQTKLYDDFTTLNRLTQERDALERKKKLKIGGWAVAGLVFLVWISGAFDGPKAPAPPVPSPGQSSLTPQTAEASGEQSQHTYHVPSYASAELDRDSAAIELQKSLARQIDNELSSSKAAIEDQTARADAMEQQVESLKAQIDQEEPFVDNSDSLAVANYNGKVSRYNNAVRQARAQRNRANAMVDPFNSLVSRANAQNRLVNQMVDSYNEKLRRVGH
jgi:hypothetical protein